MKALFNRFNRGLSKEKDRDKDSLHREKIPHLPNLPEWPPRSTPTPTSLATFKPLPDISFRPLPPIEEPSSSNSSSTTPTPNASTSPLPPMKDDRVTSPTPHPLPPSRESHSRSDKDSTGRSSRRTPNGSVNTNHSTTPTITDVQKKVAFISPPPTPGPTLDRQPQQSTTSPAAECTSPTPPSAAANNPSAPAKTNVSRFQAAHVKDTRGSTSTTATSSKVDVATTSLKSTTPKPGSTRTATTSPYPKHFDGASIHQSLRSGTPYSQVTNASSRILSAQSWSEGAEEDLVSNLGARERTRQEVLWEIVASEGRYVSELIKLRETFIDPLLHPFSTSPVASPTAMDFVDDFTRVESPRESLEHLPIAARFLSPLGFRSDSPSAQANPTRRAGGATTTDEHNNCYNTHNNKDTPNIDGESMNSEEEDEAEDQMGRGYSSSRKGLAAKHNHPRSPYGTTANRTAQPKAGLNLPFPIRSHQSLPPPPRVNQMTSSTHSLGRQSFVENNQQQHHHQQGGKSGSNPPLPSNGNGSGSRVLRKWKKSNPSQAAAESIIVNGAVSPNQLPEDLRKCLEVIEGGILEGHMRLSEGLKKRYDEQYPLVRSLADVFVTNSHILHGYATYVLHLERALEQVDNALSTASATKKPKKQDADQWLKVCQYLQKLERQASDKGETGLAISLSKPFQRLLKYPLLFQNLLYHTDPSTFEYESTLQMVAEVETIVRSIEDEKIQKEERDKTRDVFARIDGLEKVKQLMVPKPSRVLMEERPALGINPLSDPPNTKAMAPPVSRPVKGKTSFKRLSDVLQAGSNGVGGKKDQWLVVFNDVVLRCQRTGTTSLPLVAATNARSASMPELQGKAKYATTGRRNSHTKPRNLYKFLKIETWAIGDVVQPREGVVAMEDVVRSQQRVHSGIQQPRIVPLPDDDDEGGESDDSDRKSKMSFSYWGADKVTLQKPVVTKPRQTPTGGSSSSHHHGGPGSNRRGGPTIGTTVYGRESSANAKFGTRLVSADGQVGLGGGMRPASRRTQTTTPTSRRGGGASTAASTQQQQQSQSQSVGQSDEGHSVGGVVRATVTRERPAWDGSTSTRATATPIPKRSRNTSQTSAATSNHRTVTSTTTTVHSHSQVPTTASQTGQGQGQGAGQGMGQGQGQKLASPAPSEDSGIGIYRHFMIQNPSLSRLNA